MKRIFTFALGALAMVAVALVSAFVAMRLAIHGREAVVPALTGLTVDDASRAAGSEGLQLNLENHFYSSEVPAGRILAQDPEPGVRVRRDWPVRITESLGAQQVSIPDLTGESERAATVTIRRQSLELGTVAYLDVAGDPDVVLTQTPPVNAGGVDGPRVGLLVSDPGDAEPQAYVMPSLVGLSYSAANLRASAAGLRMIVDSANPLPAGALGPPGAGLATAPASPLPAAAQLAPGSESGLVAAQYPQPGRRVAQGEAVHVTLTAGGSPAVTPAP